MQFSLLIFFVVGPTVVEGLRRVAIDYIDRVWDKSLGVEKVEAGGFRKAGGEQTRLREIAIKLGLEITTASRTNTRGYPSQDVHLAELLIGESNSIEKPVVGLFGVLDGHGPLGDYVSRIGSDAVVHSAKVIFKRKDALPYWRDKATRMEVMKRHMKDIIDHASTHVARAYNTHDADFANSGATITVVLWDFEGNFLVVGSMGDSPAYVKLRNLRTGVSQLRCAYTDQNMASFAERRRSVHLLEKKFGLVPVAKVVSPDRSCYIVFGRKEGVQSNRTRRWILEELAPEWASRGRMLVQQNIDKWRRVEDAENPRWSAQPLDIIGSGSYLYADIVESMGSSAATSPWYPHFQYSRYGSLFDFRHGSCQLATALGHNNGEPGDRYRRRDAMIDIVDFEGLEVEYLLLSSDGLTGPLAIKAWSDIYRTRVLECDPTSPYSNCLPDIVEAYLNWLRGPDILSPNFEQLQEHMSHLVEEEVQRGIDKVVQEAIRWYPENPDIARSLERFAVEMHQQTPIQQLDDITILAIRPNRNFK